MSAKFFRRKSNPLKKTDEGGFTLVEVLVAMTVLSVGILALTMMMKQSVGSTDYGRKVTVAENLAMQRIEELKAGNDLTYIPTAAATPEDYGTIANYPEYRREVAYAVLQGADGTHPEGFLQRVTVTVRWRSVGSIGLGGSVTLATFLSK